MFCTGGDQDEEKEIESGVTEGLRDRTRVSGAHAIQRRSEPTYLSDLLKIKAPYLTTRLVPTNPFESDDFLFLVQEASVGGRGVQENEHETAERRSHQPPKYVKTLPGKMGGEGKAPSDNCAV